MMDTKLNLALVQHTNTNCVPTLYDGKVMHVGVSRGDVAQRVVTVGHPDRATMFANEFLDTITIKRSSTRGFLTFTGTFENVTVSIISIGMGAPMMDFFVREVRSVVDGTMAIIRVGTCGTFQKDAKVGTIAVASEGSIMVTRNYDYFLHENGDSNIEKEAPPYPYSFSQICPPDKELTNTLISELNYPMVRTGLNISGDSFYSTQGRTDANFEDHNRNLIENEMFCNSEKYPTVISCEMETFQLLHLAHCSKTKIRAASMAIALANRITGEVASKEKLVEAERAAGIAALRALIQMKL